MPGYASSSLRLTARFFPTSRALSRKRSRPRLRPCAPWRSTRSMCSSRRSREQRPSHRAQNGAVSPLSVGRHRATARVAVRGGNRRLRTRDRRGCRRERRRVRPPDHGGGRGLDGGSARRNRAQHPADRPARAGSGRHSRRGRDRRGGQSGKALRNRRCCTLGERHSWSNRQRARFMSAEESLARAEELLARLEQTRAELERLTQADDADKALDVLTELSELSKAIEDELQKAKREADAGAEP